MCEAVIGLIGVVVGACVTLGLEFVREHLANKKQEKLDKRRLALLKQMLESSTPWRKFETLSRVVGADESETKRLLIKLGARGSEKGDNVWALISRKPLPTTDK